MALHIPKAPGFAQMLKDGARHFSGLEEAVNRNISTCKQFSDTVRTAYGPNGMNKIIINHIEKLFVTNDAATIIKELEVEHPAARLMILASEMQEKEIGDGTNFVIIFSSALLEAAEDLLRMGLTPTEIVEGYEKALNNALEILPNLVCHEIKDVRNEAEVKKGIKTAKMSKQYGNEEFLANMITKACVSVLPEATTFNVDNVRVCKILGSGLFNSQVIQGMVFKRNVEGDITKKSQAKIAVFTCAVDIAQTETKGTVLIKNAEELLHFSRGEESMLEEQIKAIADSGANVIVAGSKFGDMALHYVNKYKMMAVRLNSKFDLRRLCKAVNATALPRLTPPNKEELGYADSVFVDELGDTSVVIFRLDAQESRIATIVVRGSTDNYMDDIERAIDDGVNTFKGPSKDGRLLPGAGAVEIELARQLTSYGETLPGLDQYSVTKFAVALESFVKTLSDNTGVKSDEVVSKLHAAHQEGKVNHGFDIQDDKGAVIDAKEAEIFDLFLTVMWGLKFATNAACTILKVDQIIMTKRAGGPTIDVEEVKFKRLKKNKKYHLVAHEEGHKGTVLIKNAEELLHFSRGEECMLEEQIKAIADSGANVIVAGSKFGDMALHYVNKYKMMAVRLNSKFDLRRLCKAVNATALPRLTPPNKEELGYADSVFVDELGDTSVVIFRLDAQESRIATIVVRGSTDNYMNDTERAIDDGVNTFKGISKDGRLLPGAGAVEIKLARQLTSYGETLPGLDQYSVTKFAVALESFVKTLSDNTGVKSDEVSKLYAAHQEGKVNYGFDIQDDKGAVIDAKEAEIFDLFLTVMSGLKFATNAACTILKVDQIIMAKLGGPKAPSNRPQNDDG